MDAPYNNWGQQAPPTAATGDSSEYLEQFRAAARCKLCSNFEPKTIDGIPQSRVAFDFGPAELEISAISCPYCSIVLAAIQEFEPESLKDTIAWIYARGPADNPHHTLSLEVYFKDSLPQLRPKLELELHSLSDDAFNASKGVIQLANKAFQPKETLSKESLSWATSHVNECLKSHFKCPNAVETTLPPRVLWLSKTETGDINVTLKETDGAKGVYACLSHRWGGSKSAIATRETYTNLLGGIPWKSIPSTYQDVMQFALSMGIGYIWIDSLCIIQDDALDWQRHSECMSDIYEHSYVTFAATASENNESGCFWDPQISYERRLPPNVGPFAARRTIKHWERLWTSNSERTFPLLTRAWVFQERLLSPRVLHFSKNELVWECTQLGDCQCGGYNPLLNPKRDNWAGENSWRLAVELFTSLRLTQEQDRLPAFLGFANFYARSAIGVSMHKGYLAGLWETSLHTDLLWRVASPPLERESQPTLLCRCFDLISMEDTNKRCHYSYSAACSMQCFQQRKFCRYGKLEAGVSYTTKFGASSLCCGSGDAVTSIQELCQSYGEGVQASGTAPEPSWSWVSAHVNVKFWHDFQHIPPSVDQDVRRDFLTPCKIRDARVDHDGQNLVGTIRSAELQVDGWIARANLEHRYLPDPNNENLQVHNIFRYGLTFVNGHLPLEFYPDYILCLEGPGWIPEGMPLFLLHVTCGIHLVLQEEKYFKLGRAKRLQMALQSSSRWAGPEYGDEDKYTYSYIFRRIGILRSPRTSKSVTYWPTQWTMDIIIR
ncbi:heterokaryon incompatibility protein-domain-containing protein [Hypomontagnella monticulosa]|nr:heterokaryon incompatibility protein-domain-containing protein [Hypomontagnella monticulosa]